MSARGGANAGAFRREPGDWTCQQCNEVNFKSRDACRRCSTSRNRPAQNNNAATGSNSQLAVKPSDWICQFCNGNNFAGRNACFKCNRPKPASTGSNIPPRSGDWICNFCQNNNFASRPACHKCGRAKSGAVPMEVDTPRSPPPTAAAQAQVKPGDWKCSSCPETNFGSRIVCRSCGANRPSAEANNKSECVICMDKPIDSVITTCGHSAVCLPCGSSITQCPICRNPFTREQIIKLFNVY